MVSLRPMQTQEYLRFEEYAIRLYADESAAAGRVSREESLKWAEEETRKILAKGIETSNHLFYVVEDDSAGSVGYIWCGQDPDRETRVFLFTILIFEEHQNRGIGYQAMQLYRKMGYRETDLVMSKELQE